MRHIKRLLIASALPLLMAVFLPQNLQAQITEGVWQAEYYANPDLGGPVVFTETVPGPFLDEEWGFSESPGPGVPSTNFSARFTTRVTLPESNHNFKLSADDGARLYINGQLLIDAWEEGEQAQGFFASRVIPVPAGTYVLTVEYYELFGVREVAAQWEATEDLPSGDDLFFTIPGTPGTGGGGGGQAVGPADPTAPYDAWRIRYFDDANLTPPSVAEERVPTTTTTFSRNWGFADPPAPGVPGDEFSAVIELNVRINESGNFKFAVMADDGARVAINGAPVINAWDEGEQAQNFFKSRVIPVPAGTYTLGIEFTEAFGEAKLDFIFEPTTDDPAAGDFDFFIPGAPAGDDVVVVTPPPPGTGSGGGGGGAGGGTDQLGTAVPGLFVDQFDGQFIWSGSQNWLYGNVPDAVNISYIYTDNSQFSLRMYGRWNLAPPEAGLYDVYAYVPTHDGAATRSARYRVFNQGVLSEQIIVDQEASGGTWVFLGAFTFNAGGSQYVYLNDLTFEQGGTTDVLFDAVQLIPR